MKTVATVDDYLASVSEAQRTALERLRAQIRSTAPAAIETIAYGIPGFRLNGRYLVGFGVNKDGCSFYAGKAPIAALGAELAGYRLGKGTIAYPADQPLPDGLVARLIEARLAEFGAG